MKVALTATAILLLGTFHSIAEENKTAIVNIQKIEQKSSKVEHFRKALETKQSKYQSSIHDMETAISKKGEEIKKKASVLSSDQIKNEESKIQAEVEKYTKHVQKINNIFDLVKAYGISDLNDCVAKEIDNISKNHKLDLVLSSSAVAFKTDKIIDITDEVMNSFDKSSCKIDVDSYFKKAEKEVK